MKTGNYRQADLKAVLEEKKKVLNHIEQIESYLWTDDVDAAIERTVELHTAFIKLSKLQSDKRLESKVWHLQQMLNANGISVKIVTPDSRHKNAE